ncbi:(E)-4-hydroxy-3-methylbut-2-enyl-diphosphate synthase [Catalinimonas alkaloidigena]|uniref:4-hydroxy-3-methylbut-2-en-1-yl diphosphate synthase (flavodoxin) n=1 Tax=Catalinimonas alkaloidigena TaxID=1075417 RepID=A0A1G9LNY5_9BACT|nr:(E)-4-hydroxy-3-methylbut-2-enyl-diphosphate synthase [Catalinimonas alkaloidigena]SDL63650.1 (E)-4-hydroxy-3-methylbut-2-enyl-diphosphate synthase [Catalinimonas alkaloidigena]
MNLSTPTLSPLYCPSLTRYERRRAREVFIGDVPLGGDHPIRVQSMTTVDTMDTIGSVEQSIRMIEAGCEYVRITAPSLKEAQNLEAIRKELHHRGYRTPLVADIHFTPNAAELAARIVEKVRVNPGNYADKKRFQTIDYTDATYEAELDRIRERFTPLVKICKEYGTAMRIGTNHGSLSDRILSRYGDTPLGMVESALEFLRICEDLGYYEIVLSMKASNTQVMVEAYRLLVQKLDEEGLQPYPLHLGVTEAGEGEDGRIKSAVGIGTLLEDGLGDTVRVSLTEEPEFEAPVAQALIDRYTNRAGHAPIAPIEAYPIDPYQYHRRQTREVVNFGGAAGTMNVPRVIADISRVDDLQMEDLKAIGHFYLPVLDKWKMNDQGADYLYSGDRPAPFMLANGTREILNHAAWLQVDDQQNKYPLFEGEAFLQPNTKRHPHLNFVRLRDDAWTPQWAEALRHDTTVVLMAYTENAHAMPALRRLFVTLLNEKVTVPVVLQRQYTDRDEAHLQLDAATDFGGLLIDGMGDGVMLSTDLLPTLAKPELLERIKLYNATSFGVLQAARTRMSKTEYISCPSCGRTLFDLQETTAMIRKRTDHLKGVKIGIMGCIVNGPGEMADADYGYVGVGKGKIALYRGQNVIKKAVPAEQAVDELIGLIREDGHWREPDAVE